MLMPFHFRRNIDSDFPPTQGARPVHVTKPTDIAEIPDLLTVDPDEVTPQSKALDEIIATSLSEANIVDQFFEMRPPRPLMLSRLKTFYDNSDHNVLSLLSARRNIEIDEQFKLEMGTGRIKMETNSSMIDYQLTVGNRLGFSPLLPNARSDPQFCFQMDLQKPYREFKGKNAMLGFDPAGRMTFVGRCRNEDVFLAMVPNNFLDDHTIPTRAGYTTGKSSMPTRHYRQMVMMLAHFLSRIPELAFHNPGGVYKQSLNSDVADFSMVTNAM